jgi:hypothetical protein
LPEVSIQRLAAESTTRSTSKALCLFEDRFCFTDTNGDDFFTVRSAVDPNVSVHSGSDTILRFDASLRRLSIGGLSNTGNLAVLGTGGNYRFFVDGDSGAVTLRDENGVETVTISSSPGDVVLAGADCAEQFRVSGAETAEPGAVLVIGEDGQLSPCSQSYDRRVVGVVSGANGLRPGMILNGRESGARSAPIALSGRVYCQVDARYGAVAVGDLLTTSSTPGYAMKAADPLRAFGAVFGKALTGLAEGKGLVRIIVALQ